MALGQKLRSGTDRRQWDMKTLLQLFTEFEEACQAMQSAATRAMTAARDLRLAVAESTSTKTEPCAPPEMAVHAPSTVPPADRPDMGFDAVVGPRGEILSQTLTRELPTTAPNVPDGAVMTVADSTSPSKSRGEYTAKQWLDSKDFDAFVKNNPDLERLEPLELTRLCDAFLASVGNERLQSRWGKPFKKFFATWKAGS